MKLGQHKLGAAILESPRCLITILRRSKSYKFNETFIAEDAHGDKIRVKYLGLDELKIPHHTEHLRLFERVK